MSVNMMLCSVLTQANELCQYKWSFYHFFMFNFTDWTTGVYLVYGKISFNICRFFNVFTPFIFKALEVIPSFFCAQAHVL